MNKNIEDQNKVLVKSLIEDAFNRRKLELLPELLHDDFVNHQDLLEVDTKKGPGVFVELYTKMFECFPDIQIHNHMLLADGDKVIMFDTLSGTNTGPMPDGSPPSGRKIEYEAFNILRLKDGKVMERWGLTDQLKFFRQLGMME